MAGRLAVGDMAKRVAQYAQARHLSADVVRPGAQFLSRQFQPAILPKDCSDLGERETCRFPERDQGKLEQDISVELPP